MGILIILIITEVLTPAVLRQHFYSISKAKYFISIIIHVILSIWLWVLFFEINSYNGFFDTPRHIWLLMNMKGMICAVVIPRVILNIFHFTGRLVRIKTGGHLRWLTNTGLTIMVFILSVIAVGTLYGKFNFKTDAVTIKIKGLNKDLDGLKIVQLSDMHLSGFYNQGKLCKRLWMRLTPTNLTLFLIPGIL
jgi:hypothetical protein